MSVKHGVLLRPVILLGVVAFGFYLAVDRGFVQLTLSSDRSYLSYVILVGYAVATVHWLYVAYRLSAEKSALEGIESGLDGSIEASTAVAIFFGYLKESPREARAGLLQAMTDRIHNRHAPGHFVADLLLKLGLLGTIVGFILMLLPVAEMTEFHPSLMQKLLGEMSQGMAVALYTTLSGLITSTLLQLQYQVIDGSAAAVVTRAGELSELIAPS